MMFWKCNGISQPPNITVCAHQIAHGAGGCRATRVAAADFRRWILDRRIEHVKIGRAVRLRPEAIQQIIEAGTIPTEGRREHLIAGAKQIAQRAADPQTRAVAEELLSRLAAGV